MTQETHCILSFFFQVLFHFCFKHITFINSLLLSIRTLPIYRTLVQQVFYKFFQKPNTRHFWSFFFLHTKSNWPYNTKRNCWVLNHVLSFELQNKFLKQCQINWNDDACMLVHLCAYLSECNWLLVVTSQRLIIYQTLCLMEPRFMPYSCKYLTVYFRYICIFGTEKFQLYGNIQDDLTNSYVSE